MSSSDLRDLLDGLEGSSLLDAVYPEALSRHNRGLSPQVGRGLAGQDGHLVLVDLRGTI